MKASAHQHEGVIKLWSDSSKVHVADVKPGGLLVPLCVCGFCVKVRFPKIHAGFLTASESSRLILFITELVLGPQKLLLAAGCFYNELRLLSPDVQQTKIWGEKTQNIYSNNKWIINIAAWLNDLKFSWKSWKFAENQLNFQNCLKN